MIIETDAVRRGVRSKTTARATLVFQAFCVICKQVLYNLASLDLSVRRHTDACQRETINVEIEAGHQLKSGALTAINRQ
jgi:hypothetical protein